MKWVVDEPGSEAALALRSEDLMAPVLWLAESANALWRRVRIGDITGDEADARLLQLLKAPVTSLAMEPLLPRSLAFAREIGHPIYDCIYLALALGHDTHVITADRRFVAAASRPELAGRVRLLVP